MLKKILALVLAVMMLSAFAVGCKKKPVENSSSGKKPSSSSTQVSDISSEESSEIADEESSITVGEVESDDGSSYWPYPWTIETTSAYFRDSEEAKQSVTVGDSVKQYTDHGKLELGIYHSVMKYCTHYGTDFASREREFADVVRQGYFNTYMISMNEYMMTELKYIAEAGCTFWLSAPGYQSARGDDINRVMENTKVYIQMIKDAGYYDLFQGWFWDEPIWHGLPNKDYQILTEALYKTFGKRNGPVFATGEFTDSEGNETQLGTSADQMRKLEKASFKYLTDIGYDSYSVDVREGASNGGAAKYQSWSAAVGGKTITNGKEYYRAFAEYLRELAGHEVNYWWWPTAYTTSLWGGLGGVRTADEQYCIAHLNFMCQEAMDYKYAGGVMLYTFPTTSDNKYYSFAQLMDLKGDTGDWAIAPEIDKWEEYCKVLRDWCKKFNEGRDRNFVSLPY
ncbi:MAG: hypothetical protein IJ027_04995 [Oscillospiraceae bacterium]|nr:hypothetical protein [Oscillospiraceae bacterium]